MQASSPGQTRERLVLVTGGGGCEVEVRRSGGRDHADVCNLGGRELLGVGAHGQEFLGAGRVREDTGEREREINQLQREVNFL